MKAERPGDNKPSRRHSLQWRLPALFGGLVVLMLGTFLWATYREVETTLARAAHARAQIAADQVAGMLAAAFEARTSDNDSLALDPDLQAGLRSPSAQTRAAARVALESHASSRPHRAELWDTAGSLVLEINTPSEPDSVSSPWSFPAGTRPTGEGVSTLRADGEANYFDLVVAVRDGPSEDAAHLGYLRRFGRITSTSGGVVRRLIGEEAVVKIGTIGSSVWTDFYSIVDAPPPQVPESDGGEFRAADGQRWVGAVAEIGGTPWVAWVGFPRALIVGPARTFLERTLLLGLVFVVIGVTLAGILGVRLTRPLHALVGATEQIASGDYTRRVTAGKGDEIGRLGIAFNTMADRIEEVHGALKDRDERTRFALSAARIGVWEADPALGQLTCSDSMRFVLGHATGPLPRTHDDFLAFLHPDDREAVRRLLQAQVPQDDVFDLDCRVLWPDGSTHWIEGKGRVQVDETGRPISVLGVSMDVTDRRRLEGELRQSQKLEAVGRMAGGIAHDFNNLLNVIKGCAFILRQDLPEASHYQEDAAEIERAADRAASLTQQLLAFSRKQVLEPRVFDLNELVREIAKLLGRTLREDIDLITSLEPSLSKVEVDPGQIHQVLMNLAMNARDAMPHGGALTIETCNVEIPEGEARHFPFPVQPGNYACLRVRDTGEGMDAETQAHIFEPFFTTKEFGKGTGLGLATVYGIVNQSGGHILVESGPGEGTTFEIHLPRASRDEPEEEPIPRRVAGPARGETILTVEDDAALRKLFRRVLERGGYTVLQAANGEEALQVARYYDGKIDLVISDVIMPVMGGTEMAQQLSERHPGLRILFTSGYAEDEIARHGVRSAGTGFLQKPIAPEVLLDRVRELLHSTPERPGNRDQTSLAQY